MNAFFQRKLQAKFIATDYSVEVGDGASTIYVAKLSDGFTATAIVTTTGAVTTENLSDTKTSITLTRWLASAFTITDYQKERIAKSYRLQEEYMDSAAYSVKKVFDNNVIGNVSSANFTVGNSGTDVPATTIEHALAIAESQSIPFEKLRWLFHPKNYWQEIMKVQKYYDASQFGKAIVPFGYHDMLYGIPVLLSLAAPAAAGNGHYGGLISNDAIGYALSPKGLSLSVKEPDALRTSYYADLLYGHTLIDSTKAIAILGNN